MMTKDRQAAIINLINHEVVPALGCTEPVAVALAAAKSRAVLGQVPDQVTVRVSPNILKNGMGVGIPGTGMAGLPIAAALGAVGGRAEQELEVLKGVDDKDVNAAILLVEQGRIAIKVKEGTDRLYIESICSHGSTSVRTIISHRHTNIVLIEKNGQILFRSDSETAAPLADARNHPRLSVKTVYDFACQTPLNEIRFILAGRTLNLAVSREGMTGKYGLKTGYTIQNNIAKKFVADDLVSYAMSVTAAASDARMDGCSLPVMSNSGSGNQGITTFLPVVAVAEKLGVAEERMVRGLILSNLMAIYFKTYIGQLTALCGILPAATGAACGICYLLGGKLRQIESTIRNMTASLTGMICDGAKKGCALKVSAGVSSAVYNALLAMAGASATQIDGIISSDIDKTLENVGRLARIGMLETDRNILETILSESSTGQPFGIKKS